MKMVKIIVTYVAFNLGWAYVLYQGVINQSPNWMNVITFFTWVRFLISFVFYMDIVRAELAKYPKWWKTFVWPADFVFDLISVGVLVYFGHMFLGTLYFIHTFNLLAARQSSK